MKEFKGTPGPWCVVDNDVFYDIATGAGINIGDVCASQHCFDDSEHRGVVATANANLIAAAPELLESLQKILVNVYSPRDSGGYWHEVSISDEVLTVAKEAIAKALGE